MKAVVFIDGPRDKNDVIKEGLESVMSYLKVERFDYAIANVPAAIERIISEDDIEVVVTCGCKCEVQAIATKAGKMVIEYQKDTKKFSGIKTFEDGDATQNGGASKVWTRQYYPLLG